MGHKGFANHVTQQICPDLWEAATLVNAFIEAKGLGQPEYLKGSPFQSAAFVFAGLPYAHRDNDYEFAVCITFDSGGLASGQQFCCLAEGFAVEIHDGDMWVFKAALVQACAEIYPKEIGGKGTRVSLAYYMSKKVLQAAREWDAERLLRAGWGAKKQRTKKKNIKS